MAHATRDRFSDIVDAKLRDSLVQKTGVIWNNRFQGDPKAGAVKIPVRSTEATVADYVETTGATLTNGTTTLLTLTIDKDKVVNELIDGYDEASVPANLVADRLDSAGFALALQMDDDAVAELEAEATAISGTTALTATTVYAAIVDARTTMSTNKVPLKGRWLLVPPATYALLLKSTEFIKASDLGDAVVQTGAVGQVAGFTVFEANNLSATTQFICGHPDWCARVEEWSVEPKIVSLDGSGKYVGASAVQGRKIYAHKVTNDSAVLIKTKAP